MGTAVEGKLGVKPGRWLLNHGGQAARGTTPPMSSSTSEAATTRAQPWQVWKKKRGKKYPRVPIPIPPLLLFFPGRNICAPKREGEIFFSEWLVSQRGPPKNLDRERLNLRGWEESEEVSPCAKGPGEGGHVPFSRARPRKRPAPPLGPSASRADGVRSHLHPLVSTCHSTLREPAPLSWVGARLLVCSPACVLACLCARGLVRLCLRCP